MTKHRPTRGRMQVAVPEAPIFSPLLVGHEGHSTRGLMWASSRQRGRLEGLISISRRTTECHCHREYITSLPPRAVKWKGPALEQARLCECACVCECVKQRKQSGERWRLWPLWRDRFPLQPAKPGGSQSTRCHMPHCLSSKIWWRVASSGPAPAALASQRNHHNLWWHKWPCTF